MGYSPRAVALTLLMTFLTVALAASLVMATDVYLLMFLAILVAVLFANLAKLLGRVSPMPYGPNLAVIVFASLLLSAATVGFFGLRIEHQLQGSSEHLDQSAEKVRVWLSRHPAIQTALRRVPLVNELSGSEGAANNQQGTSEMRGDAASESPQSKGDVSRKTSEETTREADQSTDDEKDNGKEGESSASNDTTANGWSNMGMINSVTGKVFGVLGRVFTTTFGVAMNFAFVLFCGVFLAMKPEYYRDGVTLLFPPSKRSRVGEILDDIGETLFNWLKGRAATMLITGVGTGLLLWGLGVPLAFTLGVVTGLATFVPNIGAIFALLLSMLVAASQGPPTVMWVVIVYGGLQFVESNIVTPLIQQHQTSVPPPLLLAAQLMMGVLTGFLGVLVATPLLASIIVLVREAYVKEALE